MIDLYSFLLGAFSCFILYLIIALFNKRIKVYIVECETNYEGSWIINIFKDKKAANIARDKEREEDTDTFVNYNVVEWDIK